MYDRNVNEDELLACLLEEVYFYVLTRQGRVAVDLLCPTARYQVPCAVLIKNVSLGDDATTIGEDILDSTVQVSVTRHQLLMTYDNDSHACRLATSIPTDLRRRPYIHT